MMNLNDNEKDFQKKLQEETEIPVIVHERVKQAYHLIENNTAVQKKMPKEPYHWMKIGGRIAGGMAAVLAVGFVLCAVNPVMAKNLPVVGGLFEMLQDNVSFFGDFSDHATTLEAVDTTEIEGTAADTESDIEENSLEDTEVGQDRTKDDTAYTKTADGLTITCSEVWILTRRQIRSLTVRWKDSFWMTTLMPVFSDMILHMRQKITRNIMKNIMRCHSRCWMKWE